MAFIGFFAVVIIVVSFAIKAGANHNHCHTCNTVFHNGSTAANSNASK